MTICTKYRIGSNALWEGHIIFSGCLWLLNILLCKAMRFQTRKVWDQIIKWIRYKKDKLLNSGSMSQDTSAASGGTLGNKRKSEKLSVDFTSEEFLCSIVCQCAQKFFTCKINWQFVWFSFVAQSYATGCKCVLWHAATIQQFVFFLTYTFNYLVSYFPCLKSHGFT